MVSLAEHLSEPQSATARAGAGTAAKLALLCILGLGYATANYMEFLQDDAFISFRYAQNLLAGHGLAWEPGNLVQGYTNFLWVLLLAGLAGLGSSFETAALILGYLHYFLAIALFFHLCRRLTGSLAITSGAAFLLVTNPSFAAYATGGLETMQQSLLYLVSVAIFLKLLQAPERAWPPIALSVTFGVLMLCRLDSAIFIFCLGVAALPVMARRESALVPSVLSLAVPGALILGSYLAFCHFYYGALLPNTFQAKAAGGSPDRMLQGGAYVFGFLTFYALGLPVAFGLAFAFRSEPRRLCLALAAFLVAWFSYVVWVGGDFMEFRMLVAPFPLMLLLAATAYRAAFRTGEWLIGALALLVISVTSAVYLFGSSLYVPGVESIRQLSSHLTIPQEDWTGIGKRLREIFPGGYSDGPLIAVTPAGAIPFHSRLRAVDMLGLNDREIARTGLDNGTRPGHQKIADARLLADRGVNLVIAHPELLHRDGLGATDFCLRDFVVRSRGAIPEAFLAAPLLAMRVNDEFYLPMLYLTPHPSVDRALEREILVRLAPRVENCRH